MVSAVVVGLNSYVTLDEANAYLGDSLRAGAWSFIDATTKSKALISAYRLLEKQRWQGDETGVTIVTSAVVNAGGTGYAVNDVLTAVGGTFGVAARFKVLTVSTGAVLTVQVLDEGTYSAVPANPAATSGGSGTGCTLDLVTSDQTSEHPRTGLVDCGGDAIDEFIVAEGIRFGQMELAFELTQDGSLETSTGTGSNNKRLKAGSAEIEYFKPSIGSFGDFRFPIIVMEYIRCFLEGATVSAPFASGTDVESQFGDDSYLGAGEGIS